MDLKQLEYFVRVAELGSFTKASGVLGIVQPALSRQIRLLEDEFKQKLLVRNGRGVTPNEAGRQLLDHARGILHQVERTREDLGRVNGALAARVVVGLPPSIGKILTVPLMRELRARLPQASLSINEGLSTSMQEWLLAGRLDIALVYDPPDSPELDCVPLMEEELYLVSRRSGSADLSPVPLRAISELPLVLPGRPNALRMLVEMQLAALGCKARVSFEVDAYSVILDLVADGAGPAVLPRYVVANMSQPDLYDVRLIANPRLYRRLVMATAASRTVTLTQQLVLETIREVASRVFDHPAPPGPGWRN